MNLIDALSISEDKFKHQMQLFIIDGLIRKSEGPRKEGLKRIRKNLLKNH